MVKPKKSLLVLVYLGVFLTVFHFLPDEIPVYGKQSLKVPKITQLFEPSKKSEKAGISQTAKSIRRNLALDKKKRKTYRKGKAGKKNTEGEYIPFVPDSLKLNEDLKIQYPKGKDKLLFPFFKAIDRLENSNELIRVVHYGDSQLEGDRITAFLREKFQETFGGCGVGIVGIVDKLHSRNTIFQQSDQNWTQHLMYAAGYHRSNSKYYGILGDYYTFYITPSEASSSNNVRFQKVSYKFKPKFKTNWTKTSVTYQKFPNASAKQSKVENIKVLYRAPEAPFELTVQALGDSLKKVEIPKSDKFGMSEYKLSAPFESVKVTFATGQKSPQVYGVALDCNKGITFDNVPLRGSSGIEFSRTDTEHLRQQYKDLNVKFLILQFGVNIVPHPAASYKWYEDLFYQQLKFLKSLKKDLSILVVGVSDMSRRSATGGFESYPNIKKIRKAQRKAAFRAGCAFWDLYEAMGGKNSMPSWVQEGLANSDYTHFSNKGAQVVSEMLYNALLSEYDRYNQLPH